MHIKKLLILIFCTLFILPYPRVMANEEVKYEIIDENKVYEIRKYSDRLAVETSKPYFESPIKDSPDIFNKILFDICIKILEQLNYIELCQIYFFLKIHQ